jgi:hypothetical protein
MKKSASEQPDLSRLRGIVAPEVIEAAIIASRELRDKGVAHALAGGLAVGAYGYPRTTDDVDFLVGEDAFNEHPGGLVTQKVALVRVGKVSIDQIPPLTSGFAVVPLSSTGGAVRVEFVRAKSETEEGENPIHSTFGDSLMVGEIPIVPLPVLVYLKLNAGRQKDNADLVELLKRGRIEIGAIDQFLESYAPDQILKWERIKKMAAAEE